jgi:hypothetical protein
MKKILILFIVALLNLSCFAQKIKPIIRAHKYSQEISLGKDNYFFRRVFY